ncbi:o-succinylbenzoate synthase [Rhodobium gokarnense]|uniref:o-succinylbenzoate synthase n=1 Tax=Rhodobium gokarnense TaxID=364296 RepID=A0ABT3HF95_9HYPH|nr:o-succinylbenzoate synthase [Rhodobium gokarnense]MCW2309050.1 o-succinylbenzoate synthase [Rhodobium gokarnense]
MTVTGIAVHPYALPLVRPWAAARTTLHERRGQLLAVTGEDGITGWGDCAPLPSSGTDGHARAFEALADAARILKGREAAELLADGSELSPVPEVRWAIETALFDLEARREGVPLTRHLRSGAPSSVAINAALGPLDDGCAARAEAAAKTGFAVAKIKVGIGTVENELAGLRKVIKAAEGRLAFRLDANRAWCVADARRFLTAIADWPIDGVEEPLAEPTPDALATLQADLPFPLAADESLPVLGPDALLEAGAVRRFVVKPARLGGIRATLALAEKARAAGIELVLTSVVDSAVGVTAAAHLAASLAENAVHGLGTLGWLTRDVAEGPAIANGRLVLPAGAGLGLDVVACGEAFEG